MKWTFTEDRPIFTQIAEQIKLGILSDIFPTGSQMPSVRDLAIDAEVNPNTMQKALAKLEESGLVHTRRTSGRYVTEDIEMINKLRNDLAKEHTEQFLENVKKLGMTKDEILAMIEKNLTDKNLTEKTAKEEK